MSRLKGYIHVVLSKQTVPLCRYVEQYSVSGAYEPPERRMKEAQKLPNTNVIGSRPERSHISQLCLQWCALCLESTCVIYSFATLRAAHTLLNVCVVGKACLLVFCKLNLVL